MKEPVPPKPEVYRYIGAFIDQLHSSGIEHAVIAPGSRSTPLVLALDRQDGIHTWLHIDERSAAYFALGLARQLRAPVAVITTSGTAAANLHPAMAEASLSRIPLIAITADRPPELHDVGANQTIDQNRIFGNHVRWSTELPIADGSKLLETYARRIAARATTTATGPPAGPVHINVPLREPLVEFGWENALTASTTTTVSVSPSPDGDANKAVASLLAVTDERNGLIVCGPANSDLPADMIVELGKALGWPILADPLSGLRAGTHQLHHVIDSYDALLHSTQFASSTAPEVILRFGAAPTSKRLNQFLNDHHGIPQIVVDTPGGWRDPEAVTSLMLHADPSTLCTAALKAIKARHPHTFSGAADDPARTHSGSHSDPLWLEYWTNANAIAQRALAEAVARFDQPFEGTPASILATSLPNDSTLVIGNSMIIRDIDSFFPATSRRIRMVGTRGASGIDGVISTAAGAAATGDGPVIALLGDLSFLHDLGGLWPLHRYDLSLLIVLINNDGGGIFHFLPQYELASEQFEDWFGTPHGIDLEGAISTFGGQLIRPEHNEWASTIRNNIGRPGLTVIELRTSREHNVELHHEIWNYVDTKLSTLEFDGKTPPTVSLTDASQ